MTLDGSRLDILTLAVAFVTILVRPTRRRLTGSDVKTNRQELGTDFLNGATLVPFGAMILSVLSSDILRTAMEGDRLFFGVGGGLGLIFVIGELTKP
jgi:hypothetical protein